MQVQYPINLRGMFALLYGSKFITEYIQQTREDMLRSHAYATLKNNLSFLIN